MRQETLDSATSYGVGTLGISMGMLMDASQVAQAIAIILGTFVVFVRLLHDVTRYYWSLKDRAEEKAKERETDR